MNSLCTTTKATGSKPQSSRGTVEALRFFKMKISGHYHSLGLLLFLHVYKDSCMAVPVEKLHTGFEEQAAYPDVTRSRGAGNHRVKVPIALYEQKYYLRQLFIRYGNSGRLSVDGLRNLLDSLGIGEVHLMPTHDEHKHDVYHKTEQSSKQGNIEEHHSSLDYDYHDPKENQQEHKSQDILQHGLNISPKDNQEKISLHVMEGSGIGDYQKIKHTSKNGQSRGVRASREHGDRKNTQVVSPEGDNLMALGFQEGGEKTDADREIPEDILPLQPVQLHKGVKRNVKNRQINRWKRKVEAFNIPRRSEEPDMNVENETFVSSDADNPSDGGTIMVGDHFEDHIHEKCLDITQLLWNYGMYQESRITERQFSYMCPAILYQIDSRVCIQHSISDGYVAGLPGWAGWGWGFLSITTISLLSLLAVTCIPAFSPTTLHSLLSFLVALAVGTLTGDAILHLIPHAQGEHKNHDDSSHHQEQSEQVLSLGKGLTLLGGIYLMFFIETLLPILQNFRLKRKQKRKELSQFLQKVSEQLELNTPTDNNVEVQLKKEEEDLATNEHNHHQHQPVSEAEGAAQGLTNIVWMVILGDGLHNFTDGLAIGAAMSTNLAGGISTSIAVLCHEIPHELGDFAVLLKLGMTFKRAIVYNLLSATLGYLGMTLGVVLGQQSETISHWIFAFTAGCFLYVSLVDMLPTARTDRESKNTLYLLLQNLGLLLGFSIMVLIALCEDSLLLHLQK
uniref:zinc transporter ZIP5-like isoform X1 n=2 Tax=Myxine glutinosa TaxID=7769 RepID=UPI00358DF876